MATSNAATNYLERRILDFIFKNNSLSFSSPGDSIYVGLATAVSAAETGSVTEADFTNYARFDVDNMILAPTPDSNYVCEFHYFYRPASLTAGADSGTTWLSTNAPNALLYGSLYEAYIYMKGEPDMLQLYDKQFTEALSRLKDLAEARENADAYRRGLPERPRT